MILWNKEKLKESIKDDLIYIDENYNYQIDNVVFDNSRISGNSLFIAKKGEKNDGHNYIEKAISIYREAIILANESYINNNQQFKNNSRIDVVKDTILAMEKMVNMLEIMLKEQLLELQVLLEKLLQKNYFILVYLTLKKVIVIYKVLMTILEFSQLFVIYHKMQILL